MARLPFRRSRLVELIAAAFLSLLAVLALQIPIEDLLALFKLLDAPCRK
jgi:hypothetical protein